MNHAVYSDIVTAPLTRYLEHYCGVDFDPTATSERVFMATSTNNFLAAAAYPNLYLVGFAVDRDGIQIFTPQLANAEF